MGRAKCGLYAGRHIQYGNRVSEDGGNKACDAFALYEASKKLESTVGAGVKSVGGWSEVETKAASTARDESTAATGVSETGLGDEVVVAVSASGS
ncbi:hypothetical protein F2Q70_00040234 [Brassica cretica]|uniref:Uncharacterized protein n=1 Tax=Brassica cretica TaxID=69181 RepID=A0A8S9K3I0_BRACR|nr:hypothetical protein F2Q70_00040234 [Brassica cretica]